MRNNPSGVAERLQLWGGIECTVNRVQDAYFRQLDRNGHATRKDDLDRFASLGISAIRYPVLWEQIAPDGLGSADWMWPDARLLQLRELGIEPVVGLLHHGSGPRDTSLIDPDFPQKFALYAGAVAARYPWVSHYTPVNEPLTTARFSGLYGVWYPHGRDEKTFLTALLAQCRATVLAMRAIRLINPTAKLVQTDDLSKTYSTTQLAWLAAFYNQRRWLAWDLICGMVDERHGLWSFLVDSGLEASEILWFKDNPCPPDIIGVNYYATSERWLDENTAAYPMRYSGRYHNVFHADIEASRVLDPPTPGIGPLLKETWERYGIPIVITEVHIDARREDQLRWAVEIWDAAQAARAAGVDLRAVTIWSLLGSFDWNCLVTACNGYYEPGPFDVRSDPPRSTALASLMRDLATGRTPDHPVLQGNGWWRRHDRFPDVAQTRQAVVLPALTPCPTVAAPAARPILITGSTGTLGAAFARICAARNIEYRVTTRGELDITDNRSVEDAIARFQPWAIINTAGYVRVDEAESDDDRCFRENSLGPAILSGASIRHQIKLMTFSSDLVFDGWKKSPYLESDPTGPLNVYGASKLSAEKRVLSANQSALIIRTSAFFGPWDTHNFVDQALKSMGAGKIFKAASHIVSPTYVPDLVHACLDLLIDGECGIWHLTNDEPISWFAFAKRAGTLAGMNTGLLTHMSSTEFEAPAHRPRYAALGSQRGILLPSLNDALVRYLTDRQPSEEHLAAENRQYGRA